MPHKKVPGLSNQLIVPVSNRQLNACLNNFIPAQPYIEKLLPFVRNFIASHQNHFLFLTCDTGELPWHFGEPKCHQWREIQAAFNYHSQFLTKNLIEDFGFRSWKEVSEYYFQHESWFLSRQLENEREALKKAFEQKISIFD